MEPSISPLAKRLAEENNVSWHLLEGSGPSGRVVERDVLEYLARVMSGEAASNPIPEPLPEGVATWPEDMDDEDMGTIASYRSAPTEDTFGEALLELDAFEDVLEPPLAESARASSADSAENPTDFDFTEALSDDIFVTDELGDDVETLHKNAHDVDDESAHNSNVYEADIYEADVYETDAYKMDNSADARPEATLFGDESAGTFFGAPPRTPTENFGMFETEEAEGESADAFDVFEVGGLEAEPFDANVREAETSDSEAFDTGTFDTDAFDSEAFDTGASEPQIFEPETHAPNVSPTEADADVFIFDAPADSSLDVSRDSGFTELEGESGEDDAFGREFAQEVGRASNDRLDTESDTGSNAEFDTEEASGSREDDAFEFEDREGASEAHSETSDGSAPALQFAQPFVPGSPEFEGGAASTEDELDSGSVDAPLPISENASPAPAQTDGFPHGVPVAPYALLRRHLDLAALLEAQQAIGLELNKEVSPTAFLLRAALKALHKVPLTASSAKPSEVAVALAATSGDALRISVVSDVDASFVALLEMTDATKRDDAQEETAQPNLIVADLSRYNLDEVVLTLGAPVLTLSRTGSAEDAQGVLSLSGDIAPKWGAELLACVAELLTSPVRLLI